MLIEKWLEVISAHNNRLFFEIRYLLLGSIFSQIIQKDRKLV